MMLRVVELGIELIGRDGDTGPPIERVKVAQGAAPAGVARRPIRTNPTASYTAETAGRRPPPQAISRPAASTSRSVSGST